MIEEKIHTYNYFAQRRNFFWRWSENGDVLEWLQWHEVKDIITEQTQPKSFTICYRQELMQHLQGLKQEGLPGISAILWILHACNPNWDYVDTKKVLEEMQGYVLKKGNLEPNTSKESLQIKMLLEYSLRLSKSVAGLPDAMKTGGNRTLLLQTLFKESTKKTEAQLADKILIEFESGKLDESVFNGNYHIIYKEHLNSNSELPDIQPNYYRLRLDTVLMELEELKEVSIQFPDTATIELAMKTGLRNAPDKLPLTLEEEENSDNLLEQLAKHPKTAGLTQLTKRLIAALNIPLHLRGSSDQLFGGVSDITNRGNFDRLLLSELANDDHTLTARLANNEALYLRREDLPDNKNKQRYILIDTTLKMWGLPRVFATAAALAFSETSKNKINTVVLALGGKKITELDFSNTEGVIKGLELIDPKMSCFETLAEFMNSQPLREEHDYFFITDEANALSDDYVLTQSNLKKPLSYLISLNRNGHLQMFQYLEKRRKQITNAQFDLEELLRTPVMVNTTFVSRLKSGPLFYNQLPLPLFYPCTKVRLRKTRTFQINQHSILAISEDQRLLFWPKANTAAVELMTHIEVGDYKFGILNDYNLAVFVNPETEAFAAIYHININTQDVQRIALKHQFAKIKGIKFTNSCFYILTLNNSVYMVSPLKQLVHKTGLSDLGTLQDANRPINLASLKKIINPGYTAISRIERVFIDIEGFINIDYRRLALNAHSKLMWANSSSYKSSHSPIINKQPLEFVEIKHTPIKFYRFEWSDGSTIIVDTRGLLHLKSSVQGFPEITVLLVIDHETAAWSSDGRTCGSAHFTNSAAAITIDTTKFYDLYIKRFISYLR
ncbi:MAG: hypothetical protein IT236_18815 [Bacteroidia bacterium]|nr:hypothetical protein [Bacteroidia bacterium]